LLAPLPRTATVQFLVLAGAVLALVGSVESFGHGRAVFALLLAGFGCATLAHTQGVLAAGFAGLALFAAAIVAAAAAWLPAGPALVDVNLFLGFAAAAAHAGWLARFWRQQLQDGAAWTTAGRLIGSAAVVGIFCLLAALAEGVRLAFMTSALRLDPGAVPAVRTILAVLLVLAAIWLALRNVRDLRGPSRPAAASVP
jgi:hypothetical protein